MSGLGGGLAAFDRTRVGTGARSLSGTGLIVSGLGPVSCLQVQV